MCVFVHRCILLSLVTYPNIVYSRLYYSLLTLHCTANLSRQALFQAGVVGQLSFAVLSKL
jgi:hypothetical protein